MNNKSSIVSIILFALTILVNYLSAFGLIPGGQSQQAVSSKYPTPVTPAGFTFSIWGLIYLLLLVSLVYFYIKEKKKDIGIINLQRHMPKLWVVLLANMVWNVVFGMEYILASVVAILVYTVALVLFTGDISKDETNISFVVKLGFGIHSGWLLVASIVNIYAFMYSMSSDIFSRPTIFVVLALVLIVIMSIGVGKFTENPYLSLATIWALWGIKNNTFVSSSDNSIVNILLIVAMVVLVMISLKNMANPVKLKKRVK